MLIVLLVLYGVSLNLFFWHQSPPDPDVKLLHVQVLEAQSEFRAGGAADGASERLLSWNSQRLHKYPQPGVLTYSPPVLLRISPWLLVFPVDSYQTECFPA